MDLTTIRGMLDEIDQELSDLFIRRMRLVEDVAEYKMANHKPVMDQKREQEKIEALTAVSDEPFMKKGIEELFSQIMALSRKRQYMLLPNQDIPDFSVVDDIETSRPVAYQGVPGAYSQAALHAFFPEGKSYAVPQWKDACIDVEKGCCDFAVLPIENSTAGSVSQVLDLLMDHQVYIVAELFLPVSHALLALPDTNLSHITDVYSHYQALMQCAGYIEQHKNWKTHTAANTALAAKEVALSGTSKTAAIASLHAAKIYGLQVLSEHIEDETGNTTRFVVISSKRISVKDANMISICVELPHESGSLYKILSHFFFNRINMTHIESRPVPKKAFEYRFFIDFEGKLTDPDVRNALTGIRHEASSLKLLGWYRKGEPTCSR